MSVSTTEAGVIRIGDGVTTVFSFSFEARLASEIKVAEIVSAGLSPVLSGFTVALNPGGSGGTVTFAVAPAASPSLYIYRETELTQLVSVSSQQKYDPKVVEAVWDKLTFLVQELAASVDRSVKVAPGTSADDLLEAIFEAEAETTSNAVLAEASASAAAASAAAAATFNPALYQLVETRALVTAGTNAQGQGPMTADQNVVTVTAANPSGVTLPAAVAGRRISVANRGTNPINIYPASGAAIGALAANAPILLAVGRVVEFFARSTTQWEGQLSQPAALNLDALAGLSFVQGDLFYATAANTLARLPKGTAGQALRMNAVATLPEWGDGADLFFRLNSAHAGANVTTVQELFPLDVSLEANSVYEYELIWTLSKTLGATSHFISTLFGGTATLNNIVRFQTAVSVTAPATATAGLSYFGYSPDAAAEQITTAFGIAAVNIIGVERGTVSIANAGTFIPQYQLSAAPGGAYSTNIGSFFRLRRLGASGADLSSGPWA